LPVVIAAVTVPHISADTDTVVKVINEVSYSVGSSSPHRKPKTYIQKIAVYYVITTALLANTCIGVNLFKGGVSVHV